MTHADDGGPDLRADLIEGLRACRAAEFEIFAALDPAERHNAAPDGGWSAKDVQAHLAAWRRRQVERLMALRENREEPALASTETDEINAIFHAERAAWTWDEAAADADATMAALIAEVQAASADTLSVERVSGAVMGNGPEHALAHLPSIAARVGLDARVLDLATTIETIVDRGGWPSRPAAFARYNLACFHALGGRLDEARSLLRLALPEQEELRTLAPVDDDLIALRDEIPSLIDG
jgi:hypothetical protein